MDLGSAHIDSLRVALRAKKGASPCLFRCHLHVTYGTSAGPVTWSSRELAAGTGSVFAALKKEEP